MNKVTTFALSEIDTETPGARLTLYMPAHTYSTSEVLQEDTTRFKNALRDAEHQWEKLDGEKMPEPLRTKLYAMLNDESFWGRGAAGLALLAHENDIQVFDMPFECEQLVCVDADYDMTPLYAAAKYNQEYYVLALARHTPKLFKADAYDVTYVDIDLPESIEKALNIDEMFANSNTQRGLEGVRGSERGVSMHGSGDSSEAGAQERMQFLKMIDTAITHANQVDTSLPLVIAATDSEAGDFRQLTSWPNLASEYVAGNYTKADCPTLHAKTWPIIKEDIIDSEVTRLIESYAENKGVQKASSNPDDIYEAAKAGRVDTLLIGAIDETHDTVADVAMQEHALFRFGDEYDQARIAKLVRMIVEHGGKVMATTRERLAQPSRVVALYRY